jgi:hypothetical protein
MRRTADLWFTSSSRRSCPSRGGQDDSKLPHSLRLLRNDFGSFCPSCTRAALYIDLPLLRPRGMMPRTAGYTSACGSRTKSQASR